MILKSTGEKAAINSKDVCPTNWHVPSNDDWEELILTAHSDAQVIKSDSLWYSNDGTNSLGFNALPAGAYNSTGEFVNLYVSAGYFTSYSADTNNGGSVIMYYEDNFAPAKIFQI